MTASVAIIVLNWNRLADTLACLTSLAALDYPDYRTVVVDNGSADGSPEVIRREFPAVMLIENGRNLGYAGGNNIGLRYALESGAEYALLLNNDTQVAPDLLLRLVEAAQSSETAGLVGPTIYYYDQPDLIWTAGVRIDWRRGGDALMMGINTVDVGQLGSAPRAVDSLTGCALLAKRAVLEKVGLLDERFFCYYEDTEWCLRAQRAGWQVLHAPLAKVWHKIPLDARDLSPRVHYYMTRNHLLLLSTVRARWTVWAYLLVAMYLRTWLSWTLKPRWRHRKAQRAMMMRAIVDALKGSWGPLVEEPTG